MGADFDWDWFVTMHRDDYLTPIWVPPLIEGLSRRSKRPTLNAEW